MYSLGPQLQPRLGPAVGPAVLNYQSLTQKDNGKIRTSKMDRNIARNGDGEQRAVDLDHTPAYSLVHFTQDPDTVVALESVWEIEDRAPELPDPDIRGLGVGFHLVYAVGAGRHYSRPQDARAQGFVPNFPQVGDVAVCTAVPPGQRNDALTLREGRRRSLEFETTYEVDAGVGKQLTLSGGGAEGDSPSNKGWTALGAVEELAAAPNKTRGCTVFRVRVGGAGSTAFAFLPEFMREPPQPFEFAIVLNVS
ncbi:hypothetical protein B0H14DRAFT_2612611 [Mycena olivaceomarginata]|nr:hypothetical protein B0H14DRAFT_2612611 [Mycena olivaceomarginata]